MFDVRVDITRLEDYIKAFEEEPIETGKIMFYGDSAFTRWTTERWGFRMMKDDLRGKDGSEAVINHGFGTSTHEEQLYYYPRAVLPWKPKALVMISYGNDRDCGYSPLEMVALRARLCDWARHDIPGIKFYICDVRPIIKNSNDPKAIALINEFNILMKAYCDKYDDCTFVEHSKSPFFYDNPEDIGSYEKIKTDIFVEDEVHYNQKGYDLYRDFFLEVLDEIL